MGFLFIKSNKAIYNKYKLNVKMFTWAEIFVKKAIEEVLR